MTKTGFFKATGVLTLALALLIPIEKACAQKQIYLAEIEKAVEKGWREYPQLIQEWKRTYKPSILWGYDAPAHPIYLASTLAFLYEVTKDRSYAVKTAQILESYGDLRNVVPEDYWKTRAEYSNVRPAISNFFFIAPYVRAYLRIRNSDVLNATQRTKIERDLAGSIDFLFHFPEWGAHNRAILRAEAMMYGALAMPNHPHAPRWKKMAGVIASDNVKDWEIEDASLYHPVWLLSLFSYAEVAQQEEVFRSPIIMYYLKYFTKLIGPLGAVPEFGDARWDSGWEGLRFVPVFEKGAAVFKDPEMKWAARSVFQKSKESMDTLGILDAYSLSDAYRWLDERIQPQTPTTLSEAVLEDVVGKKIVFRNGWDEKSTYLLLNYRDEGEGGWLHREFLRQTISVEEEKMHHGSADENSICLLMSRGSVLLTDAGYRDALPSGAYGAWRQDYFHNRVVVRPEKKDRHQSLLEFVRNSGAYRSVRTQKIDFLSLQEVDMSRTRLIDDNLGYYSDRVIVYDKEEDIFVVIDAIKVLRSGYYTFANFWHTQHVLKSGERYFDVATDSLGRYSFSQNRSLLLYFPESAGKTISSEPIRRSHQDETAIYQTISSSYKAGDFEFFVTILIPHDRHEPLDRHLEKVKLVPVSASSQAIGLSIQRKRGVSTLGVKLDLEMDVARENIRPRYLYERGKVRYGDFESDAHFFFATLSEKAITYSASNLLKFLYRNNPLHEALPNTHGLQLDGAADRVGYVKWRWWEDTVPVTATMKSRK